MIVASFAAMDVNIALGLLAALVFTLQPCNSEGRNVHCHKGLRNLQKRSGEDVVILEVTPQDQERGVGCEEYETASPFPTPPSETITGNRVQQAPASKIPNKKQLCWMYYGTPVRLYLPMRNRPNSQGNNVPYTGGMSGSGNTQAKVVCGKPMRNFPNNYSSGQGKRNNNGAGAIKPVVVRPGMAIQIPGGKSTNFYDILRSYQRVKAAEGPRTSSIPSRCT